jgi:hypothetical protein
MNGFQTAATTISKSWVDQYFAVTEHWHHPPNNNIMLFNI